jgi:effector-binding domain-containing protein
MRVLKFLLFAVLALVVLGVGVAFVLPGSASAERSIVIERPAANVHAVLDSFTLFNRWSPWADLDPNTRYTYEGPERGVGASMSWVSEDPNVGSGKQTIVFSSPGERVETQLDFGDFGTAKAALALAPEGTSTRVTWRFDTELPITFDGNFLNGVLGRWFGLGMDSMVGDAYTKGLARLKTLLEGMPAADIAGLEATVADVAAQPAYLVTGLSSGVDTASSSPVLGAAYGEIVALAQANAIKLVGPPYTVIRGHSADSWQYDAGIPVDRNDAPGSGRVSTGQMPAGRFADVRHVGSNDTLDQTHARAEAWIATRGLVEDGARMELYVDDPTVVPVDKRVTLVRVPVRSP